MEDKFSPMRRSSVRTPAVPRLSPLPLPPSQPRGSNKSPAVGRSTTSSTGGCAGAIAEHGTDGWLRVEVRGGTDARTESAGSKEAVTLAAGGTSKPESREDSAVACSDTGKVLELMYSKWVRQVGQDQRPRRSEAVMDPMKRPPGEDTARITAYARPMRSGMVNPVVGARNVERSSMPRVAEIEAKSGAWSCFSAVA